MQPTCSSCTSLWVFSGPSESTFPAVDFAPCLSMTIIWQAEAVSNSTSFGCTVHTVHCLAHCASQQDRALDAHTFSVKA